MPENPYPPCDNHPGCLAWPRLYTGRLVKRYKRFLADVDLDTGDRVTAHCPNSGRMTGCCEPGRPVWLSFHDSPKRKLKYTWEMIRMPESLVGVNTQIPNKLVRQAVMDSVVDELCGYEQVLTERPMGSRSRVDLVARAKNRRDCFIEVKNCTLVENQRALFPDARTTRGQKHMEDLAEVVKAGKRAVVFFLVQRTDANSFSPAVAIDPDYSRALCLAVDAGVEALAYEVKISETRVAVHQPLPVILE